jgi:hypothetical protein
MMPLRPKRCGTAESCHPRVLLTRTRVCSQATPGHVVPLPRRGAPRAGDEAEGRQESRKGRQAHSGRRHAHQEAGTLASAAKRTAAAPHALRQSKSKSPKPKSEKDAKPGNGKEDVADTPGDKAKAKADKESDEEKDENAEKTPQKPEAAQAQQGAKPKKGAKKGDSKGAKDKKKGAAKSRDKDKDKDKDKDLDGDGDKENGGKGKGAADDDGAVHATHVVLCVGWLTDRCERRQEAQADQGRPRADGERAPGEGGGGPALADGGLPPAVRELSAAAGAACAHRPHGRGPGGPLLLDTGARQHAGVRLRHQEERVG